MSTNDTLAVQPSVNSVELWVRTRVEKPPVSTRRASPLYDDEVSDSRSAIQRSTLALSTSVC